MHDEKNKLYITQSDSELAQLLIISISLYLFADIYIWLLVVGAVRRGKQALIYR